jgi:hypothetical protein
MSYHDIDPNRPAHDPYVRRPPASDRRMGWGIPLGLAALAIIFGLVFLLPSNDRTTTASNSTPATQTNPSGPERTSPTPTPTPPAKTQ